MKSDPTPPTSDVTKTLPQATDTYSPAVISGSPVSPGDLLAGRFRITRKIAEGGMGYVYLATDEKLNQPRALKLAKVGFGRHLPPEARSALSITHPNVCRVYEIHTANTPAGPVDFLSMEFIDGGSLSRHLADNGPFSGAQALDLATQICAGLEACHSQNLLHRDLKPNNVLLTRTSDGSFRAAVTDFGISTETPLPPAPGTLPAASGVAGTPAYLAPERWAGKPASVASDIYALGLVLHEIVAGQRPAGGPDKPFTLEPRVPARWRKVILRCLATDPAQRYQAASDVAEALSGRRFRRRVLLATAAAVIALLSAFWIFRTSVTPPSRLAVLAVETPSASVPSNLAARGASVDLSSHLTRLRPRPPQLVIIPVEETQGIPSAQPAIAKQRLGASHILRATLIPAGSGFLLHAAIVDTSSQAVLREVSAELASAGEVSPRLAALVATAFNLPRQAVAETVSPAAWPDYAQGLLLLRQRTDYAGSVAAFDKALRVEPGSSLIRARLAEACALAWDRSSDPKWLTRGREEVARAISLSPDSLAVHLASGTLNNSAGSHDRAVDEFQRAIQLDPSSAEAWNGLAQSYEGMEGRRADAADAYLKAIQLQPGYSVPLNNFAGFQFRLGNYSEAEKLWQRAVELVPASPALHANLGGVYVASNRPAEAEREFLRALELDPGYRAALNNLGALYQFQSRDADAVKVFERARTPGPDSITLSLNLGDSYRRLGQKDAALEAYRRARKMAEARLQSNPGDAVTLAFHAYFLLRLGERETARRELAQALHLGERDRTVIRRAVLHFEADGNRERALDLLHSASPDLLAELSRQPDLVALKRDPRFPVATNK